MKNFLMNFYMKNYNLKDKIREMIRDVLDEVVSTDFDNEGWGGIESQTKEDLMGYWHDETKHLYRTPQPAEDNVKHFYFNNVSSEESSEDSDSDSSSDY